MLSKEQKRDLKRLEETADDLRLDKFRINNEKLVVEKELEEVKKQLNDFKDLVNHLTSRKIITKRSDEIMESFVGFLNNQPPNFRY